MVEPAGRSQQGCDPLRAYSATAPLFCKMPVTLPAWSLHTTVYTFSAGTVQLVITAPPQALATCCGLE